MYQKTDNSKQTVSPVDGLHTETGYFLGVIPRRYVKTLHGSLHGISSMISLILGNHLFFTSVVLNWNDEKGVSGPLTSILRTIFLVSTFTAAMTTLVFYWNKVQSWQLSTTSMKDKGLVAKQMQNFNRGRGILALLTYSLICAGLQTPNSMQSSSAFSISFAALILSGTIVTQRLVQDYGKTLIIFYGMLPGAVSLTVLRYGTVHRMVEVHPMLAQFVEKQTYFVVTCVQFGFMLYYLYSRRLVTKDLVKTMCNYYHTSLFASYVVRLHLDRWWQKMPAFVVAHSFLLTALSLLFLLLVTKKSVPTLVKKLKTKILRQHHNRSRSGLTRRESLQARRASSL